MNKTILLISLQQDLDVLGLKSIHYQLLQNSYDSHLLFVPTSGSNSMPKGALSSVCDFVDNLSPLFIGISLMSTEYQRAIHITHALKNHCRSTPILWGGIHPTIAPDTCVDYADYVCIGEGETFILNFANEVTSGKSPQEVCSLAFRRNGQIIQNALYPLMPDLDLLPSCEHIPRSSYVLHKRTVVPLDMHTFRKYARYGGTTYSVMTSRGCPFSCTYCCNNALAKIYGSRHVRFRSFQSVIDELERAITHYPFIEYINFQDDCFLARTDAEMERFCRLYAKEIGRPFIARSIPTFISEDKIEWLKSAGLAWISLGLQSGSDRVCREVYRRKCTKKDFLRAATLIKERDLAAFYDVILDNPFETERDSIETVLTLMQTPKPFYTQFFSLSLYPGTELRRKALEEGLIEGDEYQIKDYLLYSKTAVNNLIRLATFLPSRWMKFLVDLYGRKPDSLWFGANLAVARLFTIAFAEPFTYLRVIWLSQRRKLRATLRVLPHYVREGLSRFRKQFG